MEPMDPPPAAGTETPTSYAGVERRRKPRIFEPFRATVHGVDVQGEAFMDDAVLTDLSAGGLHLNLRRRVEVGAELMIVSKLSRSSSKNNSGPLVAMNGTVLRAECTQGDACGVAVEFTHKRFL